MARRLNVQRLIGMMAVAVLVLGGLSVWVLLNGARPGFTEEPTSTRVLRQAREQLGPGAEVRLVQVGQGKVVCGYVSPSRAGHAVGFVSRPNRLLLSDDPLKGEFRQMVARDCPQFPEPPFMPPVSD